MDNDVLINSLLNATSLDALKNQLVPCLQAIGVPYKRLCFNVTQSGTDAPVVDVLINEVATTITPTYVGIGVYRLNLSITVTDLTKTQPFGGLLDSNSEVAARIESTRITLTTFDSTGAEADDVLQSPTSFEIRFYPGWDA